MGRNNCLFIVIITIIGCAYFSSTSSAQITVWLDYITDNHDGSGGAANGTADWIEELNQATASAGVANFTPTERATIQSNIQSHLETMFADYNVSFTTTNPAGSHDTLYFGVESGALGFAPLDIGNQFTDQIANVAPASFGFFIESGDPRSAQISEISLGLAGTAAHELGHAFGLHHYHSYSNAGITPANYAATGGLQNNHIIATGSTGLDEIGRQTIRTFSPFSRLLYDISGGSASVFTGQDNDSLVTGGITSNTSENGTISTLGTDAGSTIGTAFTMTLNSGPTSGMDIGFIEADLDSAGNTDVDVYKFTTTSPGSLLAQVFSTGLKYGSDAEFDAMLELLDSTGTLVADGSNDDVFYSGNTFNGGTFRDFDPFLVNIPLTTAGDYYLRVTSVDGGELGSNYWLVAGFTPIPEPSSTFLMAVLSAGFLIKRRRRR